MEANVIIGGIAVGVGATLVMDLWNLFLKRAFGIPSLNYCLLGRWILHMAEGTFRHASIGAAAPKSHECLVGWMVHYSIGITFAIALVVFAPGDWLAQPAFLPAMVVGLGTVLFPFFVMQPAIGLGVASSKAAKPAQARLKSLATHTMFGIGLYVSGLVVSRLL